MKKFLATLSAIVLMPAAQCVAQQSDYPFMNPKLSVSERVEDLISRLTPEEKVSMMMNRSLAIDRLGIPAYNWWGEACHGLMGVSDVTVFPQCIGLAATFDDEAELKAYSMVSDEARGRYNSLPRTGDIGPYVSALPNLTFWAPNVNIFRDPRWGRGQETYGEDPYLSSRMGLNVVKGMQGDKAANKYYKTHACAKHFAIHSGPEPQRHRFNTQPSGRDLWETYLPAFRTLVVDGDVQEVMCAYSAYEGEPCCNSSRLLIQILRDRWGFNGLVVSDCDAINDFYNKNAHGTHANAIDASSEAVRNGTDLECGRAYQNLNQGLAEGKISEEELNVALRRIIKGRIELGMFDPDELNPYNKIPGSVVDCQAHRDHALLLAQESQVLLKNKGNVLPLSKNLKRIAVVGPNAENTETMRGNYSGTPTHCFTILQGIKDKMPNAQIDYIRGCEIENEYIEVPKMQLVKGTNGKDGFYEEYYASTDWSGNAVRTDNATKIDYTTDGGYGFGPNVPQHDFTARYSGKITADFTGQLSFAIRGTSHILLVNGDTISQNQGRGFGGFGGFGGGFPGFGGFGRGGINVDVEQGKTYDIVLLFKSAAEGTASRLNVNITQRKIAEFDELREQVKAYDAVIYVGGITPSQEGEGHERQTIELPAVQQRCLKALHESGKPVVYVQCSGSCIALTDVEPYYDALLQAWYPGQEGGTAVADVLFGDFNPSGKLPVTFYKSTADLPEFLDYSMDNRTYRYFKGEPLYAFGYGQSYTTFDFGKAKLSKASIKAGNSVDITIPVTNTGDMDGAEVVQVYVKSLTNPDAPIKSLKAYKRVDIASGKKATVKLTLGPDAFSYYKESKDDLDVFPGKYQILYGNSSRDCDLQALALEVK